MVKLAKLDTYNYKIIPGVIRIKLSRKSDPILVDIMSDIHNASGRVYVDGHYYSYQGYEVVTRRNNVFLELHVIETQIA